MCELDDELSPCEVYDEKRHVARKDHQCDCCLRTIVRGESYGRIFSVFEGEAASEKICADCDVIREEFSKAHGSSFSPKSFLHFLDECIDNDQVYDRELGKYVPAPEVERWSELRSKIRSRRKIEKDKRSENAVKQA